jgi:hypothetical protein
MRDIISQHHIGIYTNISTNTSNKVQTSTFPLIKIKHQRSSCAKSLSFLFLGKIRVCLSGYRNGVCLFSFENISGRYFICDVSNLAVKNCKHSCFVT